MNGPYRIVSAGAPAALALLACAFLGAPGTLPARAAEPPPVRDGAADGGLEGLYFQDFIPKPNLEMFVSAASASLPYCTTCHPGGIVDRDEAQRALIEYNATLDSLVRMGDEAYDPENREMVEIRDAWAEQIRARAESDPLAKAMSGMALLQKTMPLQEELLREGFRLELFRVEDEIDFWLTRLRQHRLDQDWGQKAWEAWGSLPTPHRAHDGDPFQCVDPVTPVYRGRDTAYYSLLLEYLLRCRERYDTDGPEYDSLYVAQEIDKTRAKLDSVLYEHAYGEPGEIEPVSEAMWNETRWFLNRMGHLTADLHINTNTAIPFAYDTETEEWLKGELAKACGYKADLLDSINRPQDYYLPFSGKTTVPDAKAERDERAEGERIKREGERLIREYEQIEEARRLEAVQNDIIERLERHHQREMERLGLNPAAP